MPKMPVMLHYDVSTEAAHFPRGLILVRREESNYKAADYVSFIRRENKIEIFGNVILYSWNLTFFISS
jgi:hypothetical protein